MRSQLSFPGSTFCRVACALILSAVACLADNYANFDVAVYIPVSIVRSFENPEVLSNEWDRISSQLKVDKVYIEVQRDRKLASDELLERVKNFSSTAACAWRAAWRFRTASEEAASSGRSATPIRTTASSSSKRRATRRPAFRRAHPGRFLLRHDQVRFGHRRERQAELDAVPARPDGRRGGEPADQTGQGGESQDQEWSSSSRTGTNTSRVSGYDLDKEPKLFDGIYTGTETRDPEITDQNLQQYESYQIFRYFENIAPGRNGGGWVDTFSIRYVDRYAEQLWDTMFAKAPEMTLFNWALLLQPIHARRPRGLAESAHEFRLQSDVARLPIERTGRFSRANHGASGGLFA